MKALLKKYAEYNHWAHIQFVQTMRTLPDEDHTREVTAGFPTLFATLQHIWDAESIWWQRIRMHEHLLIPSREFEPDFNSACNGLIEQSKLWIDYCTYSLDEESLQSNLSYKNLAGDEFSQPLWQILMQVFNHGTYHRGQLVNILKQLGVKNIPVTDFIHYSRSITN